MLRHPRVAWRDCSDCQKHVYDERTGQRREYRGLPVLRPKTVLTPCRYSTGCQKGVPEKQKSLSEKNLKAYQHYQECKATGRFPADAIVRRNAAIIRQVEDSVRDEKFEMALLKSRT